MSSEVPQGWASRSLGSLIDFVNGYAFKPEDWQDAGTPIIRIQNLNGSKVFNYFAGMIPERYHVRAGDLLFCWSGSRGTSFGARKWEGPLGFLNQHIFRCVISHDLDVDFAYFLLEGMTSEIENEAHGGGGLVHIKKSEIVKFDALIPPFDEQQRIAEVLRSLDEAIALGQNVADQAQTVWHGLTERLIWDRSINNPETVHPLGYALQGSDYGVNAQLGNEPNGYPVLRMGNIQDGWIDPTDLKWGDIAEQEAKALALDVGDILFNRTNSPDLVGKVALVRERTDFLYASYIVRLRVNQSLADPYFLFSVMNSRRAQEHFKSIATPGVSQSNINPSNLKKQLLPLPSLAEQREIAGQLQSAETARQSALKQLLTLRHIKSNLTADLLSGRVRVPSSATRAKSAPAAFKRAVFAAEIVYQLHADKRFGSVKHEKIVHLCELHLGLHADLNRHAYKEAAGPYDPKARRSVERIFLQQKWFDTTKADGKRVVYAPLEKAGGHANYFDRYFGDQKSAIQAIIDLLRPLNREQCEIVATLYSVWNDYLIDRRQPTDDEIISSVFQWHPKKQDIAEDRWRAALPWMRQKGLVPRGIGEKTRVVQV